MGSFTVKLIQSNYILKLINCIYIWLNWEKWSKIEENHSKKREVSSRAKMFWWHLVEFTCTHNYPTLNYTFECTSFLLAFVVNSQKLSFERDFFLSVSHRQNRSVVVAKLPTDNNFLLSQCLSQSKSSN